MQVGLNCLSHHELHISQLEVRCEREGNYVLVIQIPQILRVERRHTHLPWRGSKNTTYKRLESVIQGNSEFYLKILQTPE